NAVCGESCKHGVEWGKIPRLYQRITYHYKIFLARQCQQPKTVFMWFQLMVGCCFMMDGNVMVAPQTIR
ncbi:MAG: hypothetical protein FWB91_03730, partial [Defluviitaleaceae bacterium]|nr:hypothetical protein [Defluviitaleaceae bacterium]